MTGTATTRVSNTEEILTSASPTATYAIVAAELGKELGETSIHKFPGKNSILQSSDLELRQKRD